MNPERIGLGILVFIVAMAIFVGRPASSVNGLDPVKENPARFHLMRETGDGDGTFDVKIPGTLEDGATTRSGSFVLLNGRLYEDPKSPSGIKATFTPDYYFFDPGLDLGTFAAYRSGSTDDTSGFQVGLRYSPVRWVWGTVSTDLVASADVAGAGFTLFPPPKWVGGWWEHIGLGAWYTIPFGDDTGEADSEWMYGLSFSTRDF